MKNKIRAFAVADCETDPFKFGRVVSPFLWGFYDGKSYEQFTETAAFVERLANFDGIVYAHNGGKFDWLFLAPYLSGKVLMINGRIASAFIGKAELRDSYCILPIALKAFEKTAIDYDKFEADKRGSYIAEIGDYLRSDCSNLYRLIAEFTTRYGQHITLASAAFHYWQSNFAPDKGRFPKAESGERWFNRFAPYYVGGRVQCFKTGEIEKPFTVHDINSAYPFAMSIPVPYGFETLQTRALWDDEIRNGFFIVRGYSNGAFPVRDGVATSFPVGDGEYHTTGPELQAAMITGAFKLNKVVSAIYFRNSYSFEPYTSHFFKMKADASKDKKSPDYIFAKLFLNTLYGKFGANPSRYQNCKIISAGEIEGYAARGIVPRRIAHDKYIVGEALLPSEMQFYNVAVAAHITGSVRSLLLRAFSGSRGIIYCDTDSIVSEGFDYPTGKAIGDWSREADCDYGAVAGKKLYALHKSGAPWNDSDGNWKTASKGVRFAASDIVRVARGEVVKWDAPTPSFSLAAGQRYLSRTVKRTG